MAIDMSIVIVEKYIDHPDGPGWYYRDEEYPEEGVCGPFDQVDDVLEHVDSSQYNLLQVVIEPVRMKSGAERELGARNPDALELP